MATKEFDDKSTGSPRASVEGSQSPLHLIMSYNRNSCDVCGRTGSHQWVFGDFRRRPGRGVRHHFGRKPKPDIEETRRYLMHCAVRGTQPHTACLNCSPAYISFQLPAMCNTDPPHGCNAKFDHLPVRKRSTKRLHAILARDGAGRQACVDP
jgi:hypothetical protein